MIDSHCHLNFKAFRNDWRQVLACSFDKGITNIINIGSNYKTSERAVEIAKKISQSHAAVGLHPIHVQDEKFDLEKYRKLIVENKSQIKAIGETGLDYFHNENSKLRTQNSKLQLKTQSFRDLQKKVFLKHLELAREFNLPVVLHCRGAVDNPFKAYKDLLKIIDIRVNPRFDPRESALRGVIHCFSANWQIAEKFISLGFYVGFTGIVTYSDFSSAKGGDEKSRTRRSPSADGRRRVADELIESVARVPLEKILIETDAPYLTPEPHRGGRCEPWHVKLVAEKIAEIKKITSKEVIEQTTKNAKDLFRI